MDFKTRKTNFPRIWYTEGCTSTSFRRARGTACLSSSAWSFPEFGRQVAADLQKQRCDLIHVQHSSQHVAVIVLHLHDPVFFDRPTLARRLRNVDLVTTVSDYVTQKTRR